MPNDLVFDPEARQEAQRAAIARYSAGGCRVKAKQNLTAKIALNVLCAREHRNPTPAEIALCDDLVCEPTNPGSAT